MSRWKRLFGQDEAPAQSSPATPGDELAAIRQQVAVIVRRVKTMSGRMPLAGIVRARDVADGVLQLVGELERRRSMGASVDALVMVTLESTVKDYLPTTVESYLVVTDPAGLSDDATRHVAEDQLCSQLELLSNGVQDLFESVRTGTTNPLDVQGRFLEAKFGKDDLTL